MLVKIYLFTDLQKIKIGNSNFTAESSDTVTSLFLYEVSSLNQRSLKVITEIDYTPGMVHAKGRVPGHSQEPFHFQREKRN